MDYSLYDVSATWCAADGDCLPAPAVGKTFGHVNYLSAAQCRRRIMVMISLLVQFQLVRFLMEAFGS